MTQFDEEHIKNAITETFTALYLSQKGDNNVPELTDGTVLMETGIDSLGFAILVTQLEEKLGYDPFSLSQEAFYPSTFGEFVNYYFKNQA